MRSRVIPLDWSVTDARIEEAVQRVVDGFDPLRILAFGSRARGDHRQDSDLDLAVLFDNPVRPVSQRTVYEALAGIDMEITLVVTSLAEYNRMKPWINNIFYNIEREGVVLYDRANPQSASRDALQTGSRRRSNLAIPAA